MDGVICLFTGSTRKEAATVSVDFGSSLVAGGDSHSRVRVPPSQRIETTRHLPEAILKRSALVSKRFVAPFLISVMRNSPRLIFSRQAIRSMKSIARISGSLSNSHRLKICLSLVCGVSWIIAKTSRSICADHAADSCTLGRKRQTFSAATGRPPALGDLRQPTASDFRWSALNGTVSASACRRCHYPFLFATN